MHKNEKMQDVHVYFWMYRKHYLSTFIRSQMPKNGVMHGVIHTVHKNKGSK